MTLLYRNGLFARAVRNKRSIRLIIAFAALAGCAGDPPYNGRSADEWAALLDSRSRADRLSAATAFFNAPPHQRRHVLRLLRASVDQDSAVSATAQSAIQRLPDDASSVLVGALGDSSVAIRRIAATGLGHFRHDGDKSIRALSKATEDFDDSVRTLAVLSLGARSIGAIDALPQIRRLATQPGPQRAAALTVLPNIDTESRSLLSVYVPAMRDTNPLVRAAAALMITAAANNHSAIPLVVEALRDTDVRVRIAAARALANEAHHDSTAYDALANARKAGDADIRRLADSVIAVTPRPR